MSGTDRAPETPLAGRRVLIVEDRYVLANDIAKAVDRLGGEVVGPSATVAAAEVLLASSRVDIGLLDVNLGGELVFPIAEALAERDVPFIFLTGYDAAGLPGPWRDRPRLEKPIDARTLGQALIGLA